MMDSFKRPKEIPIIDRTIEDNIQHAKTLYTKNHQHKEVISKEDKEALGITVSKILTRSIQSFRLNMVFQYQIFINVIDDSVIHHKFDGIKSSQAFTELEKYLKLIYKYPWKEEFRVLKLHSGYYNTKIKSHLYNPEEIFKTVGYELDTGQRQLVLPVHKKIDRNLIFDIAFECLVAAVACSTIDVKLKEIQDFGGDLLDAYKWAKTGERPDDDYLWDKLQIKEKTLAGENKNDSSSCKVDPNEKVVNVKSKQDVVSNDKSDIHFIDANFDNGTHLNIKGTTDDHINASVIEVINNKQMSKTEPIKTEYSRSLKKKQSHDNTIATFGRETNTVFQNEMSGRDFVDYSTLPNINSYRKSHKMSTKEYTDSGKATILHKPVHDHARSYQHMPLLEIDSGNFASSSYYMPLMDNRNLVLESLNERDIKRKTSTLPVRKDWICRHCSAENSAKVNICQICSKSRHPGPEQNGPSVGDSKKICTKCTLENDPERNECVVCGSKLKPSCTHTYV